MANEEQFVLDGLTLNSATGPLRVASVTALPPRQRQEWVTAADSEFASLLRVPKHENREITIRVGVDSQATMDLVLDQIGTVVDKLAKANDTPDGIAMTWTPATSTRTVTFDVLTGEIDDLPIDYESGWIAKAPEFTIRLTCKPYWRGTEVTTATASASAPIVTLEIPSVPGDVPALGRLIVTDTATQARRHVEWGIENQFYNSGLSLILDSDSLATSGFAGVGTTRTGAYDPGAAGNSVIRATLYGGASATAVCGTGAQSHIGTYRVKARVYASSTNVRLSLAWHNGDGNYSTSPVVTPLTSGEFSEVDFGLVHLPTVTSGTQTWDGTIVGWTLGTGTQTIDVDYMVLIPVAEGYGKARGPVMYRPGVLQAYDDFTGTTSGGALSARVPPIGAAWATAGAATDYTFFDIGTTEEGVQRATGADASPRFALVGSAMTDQELVAGLGWYTTMPLTTTETWRLGVVGRYVDTSNYAAIYMTRYFSTADADYRLFLRASVVVAGAVVKSTTSVPVPVPTGGWLPLRVIIRADGNYGATLSTEQGAVVLQIADVSTALATAGALASGKAGLYDFNSGTAFTRQYRDAQVFTPAAIPPAVYASRNVQFRHDDTVRQDSTGTYAGQPPIYRGSRFLVPPGTSRVLVKARRNDIEMSADDQVADATQIQVAYTPRGVAVPR